MIVSNKLSIDIRFMRRILPFIFLGMILIYMHFNHILFCEYRLFLLWVGR